MTNTTHCWLSLPEFEPGPYKCKASALITGLILLMSVVILLITRLILVNAGLVLD